MIIKELNVHPNLRISERWLGDDPMIPGHMEPGQNIFDQPPYNWVLGNTEIFPAKIFQSRVLDQKLLIMNLFFRFYDEPSNTLVFPASGPNKQIFLELRAKLPAQIGMVSEICRRIARFLKPYPFSTEYLVEHFVAKPDVTVWGDSMGKNGISPSDTRTYVAWADAQVSLQQDISRSRWHGLMEEVPAGYSRPDDVLRAMPSKGKANRIFRLKYYSEALT